MLLTKTKENELSADDRKIRVIVVDDSSVARGHISRILEMHGCEVVATAADGKMAVNLFKREPKVVADVMILDVRMPEMDGLEALPEIKKVAPNIKVVMASTLNEDDAAVSLDALSYGADELLIKPLTRKNENDNKKFIEDIINKVYYVMRMKAPPQLPESELRIDETTLTKAAANINQPVKITGSPLEILEKASKQFSDEWVRLASTAGLATASQTVEKITLRRPEGFAQPKAIAIVCSTGGPRALTALFQKLAGRVKHLPIFITQHMPAEYTKALAQQIGQSSGLVSQEAQDRQAVQPGNIYIAPGNQHMLIKQKEGAPYIMLSQEAPENFCRPSADPMLRSLAEIYRNHLLVVVLTGMGQDGLKGAQKVVESGGMIIAQNKETSTVWGMPGAVAAQGLCSLVDSIDNLPEVLAKLCRA